MDNIYIDTSIFEANNFFESKRINQILKLAEEGQIQIILPAITHKETQNRAIKNIREALSRFKKYRDDTRILRNISSIKAKFELPDGEVCEKEFLELFEANLKKSKCIITDYPTVNIKSVFEKYFKDEFPFSRGDKKHEFPDAFALLSVETWCQEKKEKCFVFSNDKDLLHYKSDHLIIVPSYEKYLDEKLRQIEVDKKRNQRLQLVTEIYSEEKDRLQVEIANWLYTELDDVRTYYRHTQQEIHDVKVEETDAILSDFQMVSITENEILIEAEADIHFKADIEIDDEDTGYYDSDDKSWNYLDTEIKTIEESQTIAVQLKISIPLVNVDFMEIEIDEINNGKELKLKDF